MRDIGEATGKNRKFAAVKPKGKSEIDAEIKYQKHYIKMKGLYKKLCTLKIAFSVPLP